MSRERTRAGAALAAFGLVVLLAGGCGGDDGPRGLDELTTPTFAAEEATAATNGDAIPPPGVGGGDGATSTSATAPSPGAGGGGQDAGSGENDAPPLERVTFDDPVGDATPGVGAGQPPAWSDLAGGALERRGGAYALAVRLGDSAPQRAPGSETMNIATFYDVDGDGAVEYEIWVNLGPDGWGPVWYDDRGNAAAGEDSNVTVEIEGDEVRLLFPAVMLGSPERLRFSVASEYGELSVIGSSFARRDDAPYDDRAVSFPG